ncbi:2-oxo acid dehydrogenase subunit E2, partial [Salmonella sp. SAL4444]|uniref:2-oxo acid dehydrogenase subunit E2 n=1 Tax=Salmonella sp. SAL4444 TaxID=3159899 RepID=UPI00397956B4
VYVLVGAVRERATVVDGKIVIRPEVTITATVDHRFIDGHQAATLAKVVRSSMEAPWTLDGRLEPPFAQSLLPTGS